jgi:methylmalonyl-CoA mutase cobalamin-binding domain/chain
MVVIATVRGDIHDIGKNIVALLLRARGFEVYDLGVDVESMRIIEEALEYDADIIALSALMTTTLPSQREVLELLRELSVRDKFKVMVGGGATTPEWASKIGADGWAETAVEAVELAVKLVRGGG